ncbi:MAG: hypothetical protein RSA53_00490, partial [Odoribacter sp.]
MNIDGYIDLMNTLIPNLNQYTFITDNRFYGIYTRLLLEDYFKRNGMSHPVNYLDARFITTDTLIKQLNYITHKTGLLLTSWLTGEVGFEYSKQYVYNLMSSVLKTPIFITNDIGINSGHFLGGYYFNAENWGKETGKQILDVLKYHRTTKNKCLTETQCHINWNVLEKFNILQSQLPKNTKFVNARQSFFIEYYTECIFIGSL